MLLKTICVSLGKPWRCYRCRGKWNKGGELGGNFRSSENDIESRLFGVGGFAITDDAEKRESSYDGAA